MRRFQSILCASLLMVALVPNVFAGDITTSRKASGTITTTLKAPGDITTLKASGTITTALKAPGDITTLSLTDYFYTMLVGILM